MKKINSPYQIFNKSNAGDLIPELSLLLNKFSSSDHKLSQNYFRINFDDLEEISIVTYRNDVLAFASILYRNYWPKNTVRVFNHLWKNKFISSIDWESPCFGKISKLIYDNQVLYCKKRKYDYIFISNEDNPRFLKRWIKEANSYDKGWVMCDEKKKVCKADSPKCIQYVIYKQISNTKLPFLL